MDLRPKSAEAPERTLQHLPPRCVVDNVEIEKFRFEWHCSRLVRRVVVRLEEESARVKTAPSEAYLEVRVLKGLLDRDTAPWRETRRKRGLSNCPNSQTHVKHLFMRSRAFGLAFGTS